MNALVTPRRPSEPPPARMAELATLPVFFKLEGQRVVLAGGDVWKADLLAATGAHVDIYEPAPSDALLVLAAERPQAIHLHLRPWSIDVLKGAAIAVGAMPCDAQAQAFRCAAKAAGVPVNLVDRPAFCDFSFGAIVNRSPLVIGISTDGAAPVFGQTIRTRIETLLPEGLALWAKAAKAWRHRLEPLALPFRLRRLFWERFSQAAMARPDRIPDDAVFHAAQSAVIEGEASAQSGSVAIVGAGPGDPELLTLKAVRLLQSADVVLYDDLVSEGVLALSRREARKIAVGKRAGQSSCRQSDICEEIVEQARQGRRVVRLKGGDPAIFGRLDEELLSCRTAGFEPEIVPGITTASGAAAALGFSLTRRRRAPRLQFVTAHGADGGLPPGLDLDALADPSVTTCVYMGGATAPVLSAALISRGLAPLTPVRVVINATRQDMRSELMTLGDLRDGRLVTPQGPVLILIGAALVPDSELGLEGFEAHADRVREAQLLA